MSDDLLGPIALAGSALMTIVAAARHLRLSQRAEVSEAWRAAAARLDGRYQLLPGAWYRSAPHVITATVRGVEVRIDDTTEPWVWRRGLEDVGTRAEARAPAPPGFWLRVWDTPSPHAIEPARGARGLVSGDPTFAATRQVASSDEDLARVWLNGALRATLLQRSGRFWAVREGALRVQCSATETTVDGLCQLATSASLMARRGRALGRAWRKVAAQLGGTSSAGSAWPHDARMHLPGDVEIYVVRGAKRGESTTRVRSPRAASATDAWTLRRSGVAGPEVDEGVRIDVGDALPGYSAWSQAGRGVVARFDAATVARIRALAPRHIVVTREAATIDLPGLVRQRGRLAAAVELAQDLGVAVSSAYR